MRCERRAFLVSPRVAINLGGWQAVWCMIDELIAQSEGEVDVYRASARAEMGGCRCGVGRRWRTEWVRGRMSRGWIGD